MSGKARHRGPGAWTYASTEGRSGEEHDPVLREIFEVSIRVRWLPAFRDRIDVLREKWGFEEGGGDYSGSPHIGHPPTFIDPDLYDTQPFVCLNAEGQALYARYMRDIESTIADFIPNDCFPARLPGETHPFYCFVELCLRYRIEDLPAAFPVVGVSTTYFPWPSDGGGPVEIPPGWAFVAFPPTATRATIVRLVDEVFARRDVQDAITGTERRPPRRSVADVERTYQTWRLLREWGGSRVKTAAELVRLGYDKDLPSSSTITKRVNTAVEDWDLPPIEMALD